MVTGTTEQYTINHREIEEHVIFDKRCGRHVVHDSRSKKFPAEEAKSIIDVSHMTYGLPLNQAAVGSCTGEAEAGACNTVPNITMPGGVLKTQADAYHVYHDETVAEGQPWPPNDPGGSGLAVCRAAKKLGWIKSYRHAFGIEHMLKSLVLRPVMVGVDWYEGMDNPNADGVVSLAGQVRGGHEFVVVEILTASKLVGAVNSWDLVYGVANSRVGVKGGALYITWDDMDSLLSSEGDCTVPHV